MSQRYTLVYKLCYRCKFLVCEAASLVVFLTMVDMLLDGQQGLY